MLPLELQDMIDLAERLLAAGEVGVLATLYSSHGSTYRPIGSMMVAGPGPITAGGVSGGCLEEYIARHGRPLVQESPACMLGFHTDPDADNAGKPTLGCGGSIQILVERLTAEHVRFLRDVSAARERDVSSVVRCDVAVAGDGGIQVKRSVLSASPEILPEGNGGATGSGDSPLIPRNNLTRPRGAAGTGARTMMYRVGPMTRLVVFGAGDDVKPLCTLALSLGWHVTVVDCRARRASHGRFPEVDQLISAEWDTAIRKVEFTPLTAVVMMTHSVTDDIAILPMLAEKPMAYFGVLGPAHRRQWVIDGALETAWLPEEFLERFKGPIGLNLGERSPAGIALAIAAEITAALNGRNARPLSDLARESSLAPPAAIDG